MWISDVKGSLYGPTHAYPSHSTKVAIGESLYMYCEVKEGFERVARPSTRACSSESGYG